MTFHTPEYLWLLIPLGLAFYLLKPRSLRIAVHLLIIALLLVALARPQIEKGITQERIDARDVIIALDVSYSMRARDIPPDRYRFAKATIEALLQKDVKDNVMLIAFTTNPLLLSPPTTDHILVKTALEALEPENILTKGTSLKKLFKQITADRSGHKELLLITDGGEERDLDTLTEALKGADIHMTILALGTTEGSTIPTEQGKPLRDKEGHLVISRINPLLKTLAARLGGTYVTPKSNPDTTADTILKSFESGSDNANSIEKLRHSYTELYPLPLLLALLLFLVAHTRAAHRLLPLFALFGIQLHASFFDTLYLKQAYNHYAQQEYNATKSTLLKVKTPSLQRQTALADAYYKLGNYAKAAILYHAIRTTSPKIKQMLFYNLGNAYAMQGAYAKARMYYTKALQLGEDADALHNLQTVALLEEEKKKSLGMARPKSQGAQSKARQNSDGDDDTKKPKAQEQSGAGSGSGGEQQHKKHAQKGKNRLMMDEEQKPQKLPLSSKVYELINKGYIRETKPW